MNEPATAAASDHHEAHSPLYGSRYPGLDAWRGIAACVVVLAHMKAIHMEFAHLAVMLFFVISGYCIAASVMSCRRQGLSFGAYMVRRMRRIYPPFFFSIVYYLTTRALKLFVLNQPDRVTEMTAIQYVQNFTMTQWFTLIGQPKPAAAQNPTNFMPVYWSLNYEEQFYLVIALGLLFGRKLKMRWFLGAVTAASVVWILGFGELCRGIFFEYWPMFAVGLLVYYRLCIAEEARWRRGVEALLLAMLIGGVALWLGPQTAGERGWGPDLTMTAGMGLLLIVLRPVEKIWVERWPVRVMAKLGLMSYSLYLIHQSNLMLMRRITGVVLPDATPSALVMTAQLAGHIAVAVLFFWCFERPFLNRKTGNKTPVAKADNS
ncbi:MAG: acyltransferase [Planctomycetota bacterium]